MRCFKGCFGSKEADKLPRNHQQQQQKPLLLLLSSCNEEREAIEPSKETDISLSETENRNKEEEKISISNERNPVKACENDDGAENPTENEETKIKAKNRGEGDGGNEINAENKDNPEKLLQEGTPEDRKTASMDSADSSLFSLSIDSRKQFRAVTKEQGDQNEVISPLKEITTPNKNRPSHLEEKKIEARVEGNKENAKPKENRTEATASFSSWLGGGGSSGNSRRSRKRIDVNSSPESEKNYYIVEGL